MEITFENYSISVFNTEQSADFFHLIDSNRVRLEDFFAGTVVKTQTLKDTIAYCEAISENVKKRSYFPYIITNNEDGSFIGLIDVKNIDWNVPKAEIGYFIAANFEGKGVISRGFKAVVEYLIKEYQFKKLLCRVGSKNTGSINVALKNGFELEGTIRNDYRTTKGEIVDLNYYGKVF